PYTTLFRSSFARTDRPGDGRIPQGRSCGEAFPGERPGGIRSSRHGGPVGVIAVPHDAEGLRQAALELLEESLESEERERIERLAEIEQPMSAGLSFRAADLDAEEMAGLRALHEARSDFRKAHPPCRVCGRPLHDSGFSSMCEACERAKFEAESRARR